MIERERFDVPIPKLAIYGTAFAGFEADFSTSIT
jgi:hypothetical protein